MEYLFFSRQTLFRRVVSVVVLFLCLQSFGQGTFVVRPSNNPKQEDHKKVESIDNTGKDKPRQKVNQGKPVKPSSPKITETHDQKWAIDRILSNMVEIKGGKCSIGNDLAESQDIASDDNLPLHTVSLSPFFIGKYEVTEEEWQLIMKNNPCDKSNGKKTSPSCPVDNVSWEDCQEFLKKLSELTGLPFRLPSEAEWEYAARGGETLYPYAGSAEIEKCAWFYDNSDRVKHPVGEKKPNAFGLYDMTGNVREWCNDFYDADYYAASPEFNPQGPAQGEKRVVRGGSFYNRQDKCSVSYRSYASSDMKDKFIGLRLVYSKE